MVSPYRLICGVSRWAEKKHRTLSTPQEIIRLTDIDVLPGMELPAGGSREVGSRTYSRRLRRIPLDGA